MRNSEYFNGDNFQFRCDKKNKRKTEMLEPSASMKRSFEIMFDIKRNNGGINFNLSENLRFHCHRNFFSNWNISLKMNILIIYFFELKINF